MIKKNIVVFCGSQEIQDKSTNEELKKQFNGFLVQNKEKINTVLFGGGDHGVMGIVHELSQENNITIKGYSIEKYRKYDEGNGVDIDFFDDDYARIQAFTAKGDVFLVLPGGEGTIREAGFVVDEVPSDGSKSVFISVLFEEYITLLNSLKQKNMLSSHDLKIKEIIDDISTIKI